MVLNRLIIFSLIIIITSCISANTISSNIWSKWSQPKDSPGLEYRASCKGKLFQGSKFFEWEVEVKNKYPHAANFEIAIYDSYNRVISESQEVNVFPGDVRKVKFYNVKMPDTYPFKVRIYSVRL